MIKKVTDYLRNHMVLTRSISFVLLFVLIWVLYDIFVPLSHMWVDDRQTIRTLMAIAPIICLGVGCYLKGSKRLSIETLALLIMLAGFSMRIGYAFYTGASTRQHDVEMYYNDLLLTYENGGKGILLIPHIYLNTGHYQMKSSGNSIIHLFGMLYALYL